MQQEAQARKPSGIMAQLKEKTRHQHEQTEGEVDLMRDDFTIEEYRDLLKRFYSFYKPYEEKVRDAIQANPIELDYSKRQNTPRIVEDLRALGMSDAEISEIETTDDLPQLDSKERIYGSLYVIEGSNLGGQIISRHLKQHFDGLDESNGIAFFSGYGKETGPMWKAFGATVTEFAENGGNEDEIIAGANETFEKIGNSLKTD